MISMIYKEKNPLKNLYVTKAVCVKIFTLKSLDFLLSFIYHI